MATNIEYALMAASVGCAKRPYLHTNNTKAYPHLCYQKIGTVKDLSI